jgi:hypothetical protein
MQAERHQTSVPGIKVEEVSGITRFGDSLLMVSDSDPGAYYKFQLGGDPGKFISDKKGRIIFVDPKRVEKVAIPQADLALDLESIDVLADGRVVVLSERLRSLIGENGLVREYDNQLAEFGNIGLEGLAIVKAEDGSSCIAVLWEGGYPAYNDVPVQLQNHVGILPLRPVIWTHKLEKGASGFRKVKKNDTEHKVRDFELEVPIIDDRELCAQREPYAQRFRAPDLVWYKHGPKAEDWEFIVLLSSNDAPVKNGEKKKFQHQWLQRFSTNGKPIGKHLDLDEYVPDDLEGSNWEGLSWFEPGKSLVVMHDKNPETPSPAVIIDLPQEW